MRGAASNPLTPRAVMCFPNVAASMPSGRIIVTDSNNDRLLVFADY